jgi:hypothetical protein
MSRSPDLTAAVWRKAGRSQEQGACVEVADLAGAVAVRDSKNPTGPALAFPRDAWRSFAVLVKSGRHDL